ncbi:hypothetical protein QVD17_24331 [Tagetes erecta]|uniref:Uncharacterized protein n=1 Tax=Tagetes erecta TaxID=13708 RepID=A0AAD8NUZ4_TARER|nr:hypothetical protein QVD17_24331 [Tagetes erecta]
MPTYTTMGLNQHIRHGGFMARRMADIHNTYHGGDGDNSPPRRDQGKMPSGCESSKPATRGIAKNKKLLAKVNKKGSDAPRFEVQINMEGGQYKFVGDHGTDFIRLLSNQIRSVVTFNCMGWSKVPVETKRLVFPVLYDYFNIEKWEETEEWEMIMSALKFECRRSFSEWKSSYKTHFDSQGGYDDVETARAKPPSGYDIDRWNQVVDHFLSDEYKNRSEINKKNRSKQKYTSFHGSKSFSSRRFEGKNSMDVFHETRTRKGVFQHPLAEEDYGRIQDEFTQASSQGDGQINEIECMQRALGEKPGYVRGYGPVTKQGAPWLPKTHSHFQGPSTSQLQQQVQQLQEQQQQHAQREAEQTQII